jgi:hypothetical protein
MKARHGSARENKKIRPSPAATAYTHYIPEACVGTNLITTANNTSTATK